MDYKYLVSISEQYEKNLPLEELKPYIQFSFSNNEDVMKSLEMSKELIFKNNFHT